MADALLSALVSAVLKSLTSIAFQEFWKLEDDVSTLKNTYTQIQAVLNDAVVKQREQKDVETWLKSLRYASLEVEDILDEVLTEAMLQRLHKERGVIHKVKAFLSSNHNSLIVRTRIANKVKTIRRKLDSIAAKGSQFNLISDVISVDAEVGGETINMETTSLISAFEIYGRDAEVKMVAREICNKDSIGFDTEGVQVYAIWGMGGIGKTTLAQLVYNHEMVRAHFELQSWVYVSTDFQIKKITKEIIESIDKRPSEVPRLDAMQVKLQNKLKGKRFLIVLDDVWIENKDMKKWEELSKVLSNGAKGSVVMVTTRNQTTSRMLAKVPEFQHQVGCLSEEDSWLLFKNLAFASGSGSGTKGESIRELESIGKEIVHKCEGLPLAVRTLGGLMWSKSSASEWQRVKDSDVWELQENDILPALKLSYDNLLPHMKRCFAYCCLFPKGYEMGKVLLIELWMANGFLPLRVEEDLYVIGDEVFYCLVSRSFLQDVQEDENSMKLVCKMHDLMHDLARYVMRHDFSVIEPGKKLITPDEVLHLSSSYSDFSFLDQDLKWLRSLFIFADRYGEGNMISQICNHVYLRALRLDGINVSTLPESICKLKHLRYLSLSGSQIHLLPESIIFLQNLQVLLLQRCEKLSKFPEGMRYMKNLRCLDNKRCYGLKCMPVGMKELACLGRLGIFVVGFHEEAQISELGNLNLLGRGLELRGLENVGGLEEAKSANLKDKRYLTSLVLCWSEGDRVKYDDEEIVEGLEPNLSLKELKIVNHMGMMISPSWMMNLRNLVKIVFGKCLRCESIPSLGKLPSLRIIHLWFMDALKGFDDDEFPNLQQLYVTNCHQFASVPSNLPKLEGLYLLVVPSLVSLPSNLPNLVRVDTRYAQSLVSLASNVPKLSELHIEGCPELHCLPDGFKELTSLTIRKCEILQRRCEKDKGEDWPKISHVPNIYLQDE